MRVLSWALDAQKTVHGKIISVVLSIALVFSFSNFFYGDNAFASSRWRRLGFLATFSLSGSLLP